ncbi:MAG TPA: 3-oxoacyl-ACP reductase FabG [Trebonia sp.]|nr:3-oxoacyl-ACP reductase FabG [Trebonia sp.]
MTSTDDIADQPPGFGGQKLAGRVALVTGGTRGIGAAICASLASQGALVAAGYSGNTERAKAFAADFERRFGALVRLTVHRGNIASPEDCRRVVGQVIDQHGRLDILVNNAGITIDRLALDLTTGDWDKVVAVNLSGAFYMAQAALGHMLERGTGRIINVSSIAGEIGNVGQANYAASKSGLLGLTKALAREAAFVLARSGKLTPDTIGLTVNAVAPGLIATEMLDTVPAGALARLTAQIPCGRLGRPEEVARIVHILAADASSYITGQVWGVNGGMDM